MSGWLRQSVKAAMSEVCRFYGIVIKMYAGDHRPPHFHAKYGGYEALVLIEPLIIFRGSLPRRAQGLVVEWASLHLEELHEAWKRVERQENPEKIAPLD